MLKKDMTALSKGGALHKHTGKGGREQTLPNRSAMQTLTGGAPADRTMQNYAKATPGPAQATSSIMGPAGAGEPDMDDM